MKPTGIVLLSAALILSVTGLGPGASRAAAQTAAQTQPPQLPPTVAAMVDRQIFTVEKLIMEAAEAMPENKFNFSPENLNIPGADYKGVRTFAMEVKHVAASNYALWSPLTGDRFPKDFLGGNGPENLQTKAEIMKLLKDSFALDGRQHASAGGARRIDGAPEPCQLCRCPCLRSLRTNGGVPADERNHATGQPGQVRLVAPLIFCVCRSLGFGLSLERRKPRGVGGAGAGGFAHNPLNQLTAGQIGVSPRPPAQRPPSSAKTGPGIRRSIYSFNGRG